MRASQYAAAIVTLALLVAVTSEGLSRPKPSDAEPYHRLAKQVCNAFPNQIGDWKSDDIPPVPAATALLRPNVMMNRQYYKIADGKRVPVASFLLVQCREARDMLGHYPPNCYTGQGWVQQSSKHVPWNAGPILVPGVEYLFSRLQGNDTITCWVEDFLILPHGGFVYRMEDVYAADADCLRRFYGAAQIQVVMYGNVPEQERKEITETMLGANVKMLKVLSTGGSP